MRPGRVRPGTTAPGRGTGTPSTSRPPSGAPTGVDRGGLSAAVAARRRSTRRSDVAVGPLPGEFLRRTSRTHVEMTAQHQ